MKQKIELTATDIAAIIAEKYGVPASDVSVKAKEQCVGYGMAEHMERVATATVVIKGEPQKPKTKRYEYLVAYAFCEHVENSGRSIIERSSKINCCADVKSVEKILSDDYGKKVFITNFILLREYEEE